MYRSIMVPLDGSHLAEWALPAAIHIARQESAQIELLRISQLAPAAIGVIDEHGDTEETWRKAAQDSSLAYLAEVASRIGEVCSVPIKPIVQFGLDEPARQLVEHAHEADTDLIVMATHGYGRLKRFWAGSVSDSVVRKSRVATLLVRPEEGAPDLKRQPEFRTILIPLDGSAAAETVVEHAITLGGTAADYTLMTVLPLLPAPVDYAAVPTFIDDEARRAREDAAQAALDAVAERIWLSDQRYRVSTVVRTGDGLARVIVDHAARHGVDLIAMSTHGYGGALRVMLGSVADAVVRETAVPVLLYRPPQ